jgi:hypothetical protein
MLHFHYDLVEIPWLIREIKQREGSVDFSNLGLSCTVRTCQAIRLVGAKSPCGLTIYPIRCLFVRVLGSIRRVGCFWLHGVWRTVREESADSHFAADGPPVGLGWSIFRVCYWWFGG